MLGFQQWELSIQRRSSSHASLNVLKGPDPETKPDYENIHGPLGKNLDRVFLKMFRSRLAENIGVDSSLPKVNHSVSRRQRKSWIVDTKFIFSVKL